MFCRRLGPAGPYYPKATCSPPVLKERERTEIISSYKTIFVHQNPIGVNGIAVARSGHVFVSNTANGVIHIIETRKESGYVEAVLIWRSDPRLIGADGMQFDAAGNLWIAVSARNAIVAITPDKEIIEVSINGNTGPLEFPAGLAFSGDALYVINSDSAVGENKQRGPGIGPSISKLGVGVIGQRIPP